MTSNELRQKDADYIAGTYARNPIVISEGQGVKLTDGEGRAIIDFSSGIGVLSVGHSHPAWLSAVTEQAGKLAHISNLYHTQPMAELAQKLCERTGMSRVFFGNSGAEANEGAIKTARKYMSDNYPGVRDTILCLQNSFHGRTITTLSATGQPDYHKHFGPWPAGFAFTPANDIPALTENCTKNVGAIMIECIQGEGGVVPLEGSFISKIAKICAREDVLLIVDEIQTGVGRTGKFLCCEHYDLKPDIVTLAKGLGGGLPIGAILFGEKTMGTLGKGEHGSTFGGNPICCAGANAVLDIIDGPFMAQVESNGAYLRAQLEALPGVTKVTGGGLMLGASLEDGLKNTDVVAACLKKGLVVLTAKEKLRFLPPLTVTQAEIDAGLEILKEAISSLR
ncbi:MAG: aspartate aminotransferase family protein [Oscillospiraceae bacterium]|nr:aspartate aminotransferase family protein [Oscillospiraceae bacterium]